MYPAEIGYPMTGHVKGWLNSKRKTDISEKASPKRKVRAPAVQNFLRLGYTVWKKIEKAETRKEIAPSARTTPKGWV